VTTPNQPLPETVDKLLGVGAYQVGGSGTKFGQGIDATAVSTAFNIDKPTPENKVEVFKQSLTMLSPDALSSFAPVIPDWADGDETDAVTVGDKLLSSLFDRPTVKQTWDDIVNFLFGWAGQNYPRADSQQALADQAATTAALVAAITAILNQQSAQGNSGNSAVVEFGTRANASSLGADFTQTYSGLGTSMSWGIVEGKASIVGTDNDPRGCIAVYNAAQSLSDYQMVGAAFASAPEVAGGLDDDGWNYIIGRSNAAGTEYCYAALAKHAWELGCVVSGVKTVFASGSAGLLGGFSFKSTGNYWLQCGDVGGARVFKIIEGATPIVTHTEVGTTSQLGALYRYTGTAMLAFGGFFGVSRPGRMTAFAFSDNIPPSFLGSGSLMYRSATAGINLAAGQNMLPFNFWGVLGEGTADITPNTSIGKFTVSIEGWYNVSTRIKCTQTNWPNGVQLLLYKGTAAVPTAVPYRYGGPEYSRGQNALGGANAPAAITAVWTNVYLRKDDFVQVGYDSVSLSGPAFTGEASGLQSYFSIELANKSLA
jgi:hypothetical protein